MVWLSLAVVSTGTPLIIRSCIRWFSSTTSCDSARCIRLRASPTICGDAPGFKRRKASSTRPHNTTSEGFSRTSPTAASTGPYPVRYPSSAKYSSAASSTVFSLNAFMMQPPLSNHQPIVPTRLTLLNTQDPVAQTFLVQPHEQEDYGYQRTHPRQTCVRHAAPT